ncbi:MAG: enoyl-CoA hydratase [Thermoleophilia bacterium]
MRQGDRAVDVTRDGPVSTVVLDRPERRNPLSLGTMTELREALEAEGADPSVRAVVLGARGPVFSAGHDLRELRDAGPDETAAVFDACAALMLSVHRLPVPVIARVGGLATAAGCQLVAACDLAVASEGARFATPGVRIGLFCTTPSVEVIRAVGRTRAMEMLLTGEPVDAPTALAWGLVNRVVPEEDLDAAAAGMAGRLTASSRATIASGKRAVADTVDLPLDEAYRVASAAMCDGAASPSAREGIDAFLEKRAPAWPDGDAP